MPAVVLGVVFLLKFGLLFGWMVDWKIALIVTTVDWILGVLLYKWIKRQSEAADVPRCIPEVQFPSGPSDSDLRFAA
jgi:hypothetical protein